ncbi:MAG: undecaprenyl-phosphate galactose phosphotransferase WbaP [Planctomycetota bacterium]
MTTETNNNRSTTDQTDSELRVPEISQAWPLKRSLGVKYFRQIASTSFPLMAADLTGVVASVLISAYASYMLLDMHILGLDTLVTTLPLFVIVAFVVFRLYPASGMSPVFELRQTCIALTLVFFFLATASGFRYRHGPYVAFSLLAFTWLPSLLLVPLFRSITRHWAANWSWWGIPIAIVGGGEAAHQAYLKLRKGRNRGLLPIGIISDDYWDSSNLPYEEYLGPIGELDLIAKDKGVFRAMLAHADGPNSCNREFDALVERVALIMPHVIVTTRKSEQYPSLWNEAGEVAGMPSIYIKDRLLLPIPRLVKRAMDVGLVALGSLVALPVMTLIAIVVKLTTKGPVLYSQERPGVGGKRFRVWKFRTMRVDADKALEKYLAKHPELREEWETNTKLRNDPRITRIGRILRKTSLDELPQLWNVLVGEMSLVGPRPLLEEDVAKYDDSFALYSRVKPGLTGLWQVSGRNNTTYAERIRLDVYYVRNWSVWMDLHILVRTIKTVLLGEGAY